MKKQNAFSSRAFRKGTLSVVFAVIVMIAVVLVNVVATAVSERYPFSLDLTANKDYTIELSDEYDTFVKGIDLPVEITVCAAEDDFTGSGYASGMVSTLGLADYYEGVSETTGKYARQVSMFLKSFPILNDNISVTFADPNSVTDFAAVSSQYTKDALNYGDIIISCNHPATDGSTFERYQILKMSDIFTTEMNQEYYYSGYQYCYEITGSSLAGGVVSALYIVTSEESVEVAVLGGHNTNTEYAGYLENFLKKNNYTFTEVDNLLNADIPEETMFMIVSAPQTDYTAEEIKALEEFLVNGGSYGRTLVYLPACNQPVLPKLEEFLQEWGIEVLPAISYDETEGNSYQYPYWVFAQAADSEYTEGFDGNAQYFYPMNYRLTRTAFDSNNGYTTTKILTTGENAYGYPIGDSVPDSWTVADAEYKGQFDLVVMSTYQKLDSSADVAGQSNVLVISGDYFLYEDILASSACYNSTLLLNLFNGLSGQEDGTTVSIEDKTISTTSFYEQIINTYAGQAVMIIFVAAIPLLLVVVSFVIWKKRKKK